MGNQDASELMTIRVMALNVSSNGMILMRRGLSGFDESRSREGSDWHGKEGKGGPAPRIFCGESQTSAYNHLYQNLDATATTRGICESCDPRFA